MRDIERAMKLAQKSTERPVAPQNSSKPKPKIRDRTAVKIENAVQNAPRVAANNSSISEVLKKPGSSPARRKIELPLDQLIRDGYLAPDRSKDRLSEEFRKLKRPLLKHMASEHAPDQYPNIIMVTSSVAGEGKTYTAINLAMSLALEHERSVMLIDADVLRGTASELLGIESGSAGLTDLLSSESGAVQDALLETNVEGLMFMPAGKRTERSTELLTSGMMQDLMKGLAARRHDLIVVLDCSPMLLTNEANVIMDHAGQVVFVVASEETDQRLVTEAIGRFDENKQVGILLNKTSASGTTYDYDYGYG